MRRIFNGEANQLTLSKMDLFRTNLTPHLREAFMPLRETDQSVTSLLEEAQRLETNGIAVNQILEADGIHKRLSVQRIWMRLQEFVDSWESRLTKGSSDGELNSGNLRHDVPFLIDMIIAKIQDGTARLYAVYRFRVLLEHFMRDRIRDEIKHEEEMGKPQREQIIQRHMDEFLFREGYYPLTHSEASAGYTDTVLLDQVESSRIPPLLIELKQSISIVYPAAINPANVKRAIETARGEVHRYRSHIAARPQWRSIEPLIVVVHTCRADVSNLSADDVVLIDISDCTPSQKKRASAEVARS